MTCCIRAKLARYIFPFNFKALLQLLQEYFYLLIITSLKNMLSVDFYLSPGAILESDGVHRQLFRGLIEQALNHYIINNMTTTKIVKCKQVVFQTVPQNNL